MLIQPNKAPGRATQHQPLQEDAGQQKGNKQQPQQADDPAEALVIKELLKSLGYKQYDSCVVHLLMDITYRKTADILQDAEAINIAAGGTGAELTPQDVALAASQRGRLHPQPPTLQELHALARLVNAQPLAGPSDKQHGIKLPPVADCLLNQNHQLRPRPRPAALQIPASGAVGPPRQHYAVKHQHGKIGIQIPAQWQPAPDAAAGSAEPFAPPAQQQQQAPMAVDAQQPQQQQAPMAVDAQQPQQLHAMDVDREDI